MGGYERPEENLRQKMVNYWFNVIILALEIIHSFDSVVELYMPMLPGANAKGEHSHTIFSLWHASYEIIKNGSGESLRSNLYTDMQSPPPKSIRIHREYKGQQAKYRKRNKHKISVKHQGNQGNPGSSNMYKNLL